MPVHIAAAVRSPFTGVDGALAGWHPVDLAAEVMNLAVGSHVIDEVFVGCAEPVGAQGANMARAAILAAGWDDRLGGTVVDRAETSGTAALHAAVAAIAGGQISCAMVIGVCSASVVQPGASALGRTYGRPWGDGPAARVEGDGGLLSPPAAADRSAAEHGVGRAEQDAWATKSHELRTLLDSSAIVPLGARPGDRVAVQRGTPVDADELRARPDDPSALPPSFDVDGTVTGFSFAAPADGAVAIVLTDEARGPEIIGTGRAAGHPLDPIGGLGPAIEIALGSVDSDDIGRWEFTESTAAATLLAIRSRQIDPGIVNPRGGTLAVGDAGAAEELRLVVDAIADAPNREHMLAAAFGASGSAATLLRCP